MPLEMTCRTCGAAFTPTGPDILAGPDTYWYCPSCRREQLGGYVEGDQGAEVEVEKTDTGDLPYPTSQDPDPLV